MKELGFEFIEIEQVKNNDYNLVGSVYISQIEIDGHVKTSELFTLEEQGKITFLRGKNLAKKDLLDSGLNECLHYGELYTVYQSPIIKGINSFTNIDKTSSVLSTKNDVLIPATTTADKYGIAIGRSINKGNVILGGDINILRILDTNFLCPKYIAYILSYTLKKELAKYAKGTNVLHLSNSDIKKLHIPLPPIEVQNRIINEVNGYQNIIDGAKQVIKSWKPSIEINEEWEVVKISDIAKTIKAGGDVPKSSFSKIKTDKYKIPIIANGVTDEGLYGYTNIKKVKEKCVTISARGTIGHCVLRTQPFYPIVRLIVIIPNEKINVSFLQYSINNIEIIKTGSSIPQLTIPQISNYEIPLPPIEEQQKIVAQIETEEAIINENKKLIKIFKQKIEERMNNVWKI